MSSQAAYKGRRMRMPRLINTYAAIQESFQYPFDNGVGQLQNVLIVSQSVTDMNELQKFEPAFSTLNFIGSSPLAQACFDNYDQFRVRKVSVRLTPDIVDVVNLQRSDAFIYWCPNHKTFDEDEAKGQTFSSVTDLAEASRIQHVSIEPGRPFNIEFCPQVIYGNTIMINGVPADQSGDGKMPWLENTTANRDLLLRAPIIYFRRPVAGINTYVPRFQVMVLGVIEFRNLNDDN